MTKKTLKKIFVKISRLLGYEIIDQSNFISPTLEKKLDEDLSVFNKKSIVLPLGEVKISRKVKSLLIVFRTNSNVEIWDQNKKRIFEEKKIVYVEKSLGSLIKSIELSKKVLPSLKTKLIVLDDNSNSDNLSKIKNILDQTSLDYELLNHDIKKYKDKIKDQDTKETYSNLSTLLTSFHIGKKNSEE